MATRTVRRRKGFNLEQLEVRQLLTSAPVGVPDSFNLAEDTTLVVTPVVQRLVATGDTWRYLDNGTDQGTAWYEVGFDESGWLSGRSELGYGDGDEATVVGFGPDAQNKFITTYFRRTFNVPAGLNITSLTLEVLRDDGAVVYLNETEVARENVPAGAAYNTPASANAPDNTVTSHVLNPNMLHAGENLFAVEVHQDQPGSSDISFDLRLIATIGTVGVLVNDTDADGDRLTAAVVTGPQHGTLSFNTDGTFSYVPAPNYSGTDTFVYRANDGALNSEPTTVTLNIAPVNDIPQAGANNYHTLTASQLNVPATTGVLVDDFDFENQPLTAVLVDNVDHGTLTLNADGSFSYLATPGFEGTDTFQYAASDGTDQSPPATVSILVTLNNAPPVTVGDSYSVPEDGSLNITLATIPEPVQVFFTNFDSGVPAEFTGITTVAGVEQLAGRGNEGNTFAGSVLRNAANPNNGVGPSTTLRLTNLPPHTTVSLGLLLAALDEWDGNQTVFGGQFAVPDRFNVQVDGELIFSHTLAATNTNQTYAPPAGVKIVENQNLWSTGTNEESAYDLSREPSLQNIPHNSPNLTVTFFADGNGYRRNQGGGGNREPESWAIDNMSVVLGRAPVQTVNRETLITAGSIWSYLDDGSDQGTSWQESTFDDSEWAEGPAELGYGDGDEATEVAGGPAENRFPTTYFRRHFTVTDKNSITELVLQLKRDDGAIVYINGQEVVADNVASGAAFNAFALTTTQTEANFLSHTINPNVLVEGDNVIAVEVHQADAVSSDISFDLSLRATKVGTGGGSTDFGVLQNDSDPEGGDLTAELVTPTTNGTITFNNDGTFAYVPRRNFHGTDTFTYRARDRFGATSQGTATITIIPGPNEPPVVVNKSYTTDEDTLLVVGGETGLLVGATDEDGDELRAVLHTPPQHGTVSITNSGSFQYTPNADFFGTDTFLFVANDTLANSAPGTVSITVNPIPDSPIAAADLYFVPPGGSINIVAADGVLQNDRDGDGDSITAVLVGNVTNGTLALAANGSFTYVPNPGFHATDSFTYRASDGARTSAVTTVTIRVDAAPVATDNAYTLTEDTPVSTALVQGVLSNDTDGENDPLTAQLVTSTIHGNLSLNPNGTFSYQPFLNYFGTDTFTYRASDGDQLSNLATVTFTITPVNDIPVAVADNYGAIPNSVLTVTAQNGVLRNDSDVDSATLTAAVVPGSGPSHGTLTLNPDGSFVYTPTAGYLGPDSFGYTTSDGVANTTTTTVTIDVSDPTEIVISEIMYHPASENTAEEYIEIYNRGLGTINLEGWQITRGVDFTFPAISLAAGEYLIVAADVSAFRTAHPGNTSRAVGGWLGILSNTGEDIEIETPSGARVDLVSYADEGDWAQRRAAGIGGWEWIAQHDGGGRSLEVININAGNRSGQNWSASTVNGGSPGAINTVATNGSAPFISDVRHSPAIPQPGEEVTVRADLSDDGEGPLTASVFYRLAVATPGAFLELPMFDDGLHDDGEAGDGRFAAQLPPQADGAVVEFYVRASDDQALTRTWPAPTDTNGTQGANALYQVDTEAYDGDQAIYRIVTNAADLQNLLSTNRQTDALRNATFINFDGTGTEIRYLTGVRFRGNGSRQQGNLANYRVNIPSDVPWQGIDSINLNSQYSHGQVLGMTLFELSGLVHESASAVQLRLNGTQYATSPVQQGSYARLEVTNSSFVQNHYPNDPTGNVYRGVNGELTYIVGESIAQYDNQYDKLNNGSENDWSDLIRLTRALDTTQTPANVFIETLEQSANVSQWLRFFAVNALLVNEENSILNGQGDDYTVVCGVIDPRCELAPHDADTIFAEGDQSATTARIDRDIFEPRQTAAFNRILNVPEYLDLYYYHLRDLATTVFAPANLFPVMDNILGGWVDPTVIQEMKTFAEGRVNYVLSQVPAALNNLLPEATIDGEPQGTTPLDSATLTVAGRAVATYEYRVNGGAWSAQRPVATPITLSGLADGTYYVEVAGYSPSGIRQRTTTLTPATRSGTWEVDADHSQVIISEVLAHNISGFAHEGQFTDAIELYNRGTTSIHLGGMRLSDDPAVLNKYEFPAGTNLAPGAYLVLHANAPNGTSGIHLGFSLDNDGDRVILSDNLGNVLDEVRFGVQVTNMSISRDANMQFGLSTLTLGAANALVTLGNQADLIINEWLTDGERFTRDDFIEIYNPSALPVALGGMYVSDAPVGWPDRDRITPYSYIAPRGYQVMLADDNEGAGGNHLNFNLNENRETIALYDNNLQLVDIVAVFPQSTDISQGRSPDGSGNFDYFGLPTPGTSNVDNPGAAAILQRLRITEVMYNPAGTSQDTEFIELKNIGNLPVDITGVRIRNGVNFTFPQTVLQPGEFTLVVNDLTAFRNAYGASLPVAGEFDGNLSNGGEEIAVILPSPLDVDALRFEYDDDPVAGWPAAADGTGRSLVVRDTNGDYSDPANWRVSSRLGGTPGADGPTVPGDFNQDGLLDLTDLDTLYTRVRAGVFLTAFDLSGDGQLNLADINDWLVNRKQTVIGDTNLDFAVDASDWNIWFANRFTQVNSYGKGDLNADGVTDGSDLNIFNENKFRMAPPSGSLASVGRAAPRAALDNGVVRATNVPVAGTAARSVRTLRRTAERDAIFAAQTNNDGASRNEGIGRGRSLGVRQVRERSVERRQLTNDNALRAEYQTLHDDAFAQW